jgi:hypothetical protein
MPNDTTQAGNQPGGRCAIESIDCQTLKNTFIAQMDMDPSEAKHCFVQAVFKFIGNCSSMDFEEKEAFYLLQRMYEFYHLLETGGQNE